MSSTRSPHKGKRVDRLVAPLHGHWARVQKVEVWARILHHRFADQNRASIGRGNVSGDILQPLRNVYGVADDRIVDATWCADIAGHQEAAMITDTQADSSQAG